MPQRPHAYWLLLLALIVGQTACATSGTRTADGAQPATVQRGPGASALQFTPVAPPPQVAARQGVADLGEVQLRYWDTGGNGEVVVLLHPATGNDQAWVYQQPAPSVDCPVPGLASTFNIVAEVPPFVEMVITSTAHDENGDWAPVRIVLSALAICDTDEEADQALALFERCPVVHRASKRKFAQATTLDERYVSGTAADPDGFRYGCDNLYTNASAAELVPRLRELFTSLPSPRSHVFWLNWGPVKPLGDMVLSVQGNIFLGAYSIWSDPAQDEQMERWPVEQMRKLESLSAGGQMNDENMLARPEKYLSPEVSEKLERLRAQHDPSGVFLSFLTPDSL